MIVLSPHLDDAMISTWSLIARGSVPAVVNVFTGEPLGADTLSIWDKVCGFASSHEVCRLRVAEDAAALGVYGIEPINLGYRDATVRRAETDPEARAAPEIAVIAGDVEVAIRKLHAGLPGIPEVAAPLGGGPRAHPDHVLVRDAALILHRLGRIALTIYADQPYVYKSRRWPTWVRADAVRAAEEQPSIVEVESISSFSREVDPFPDPWWHRFPRALPDMVSLENGRHVRILGRAERKEKLAAMRSYVTQYDNLNERLRTKGLLLDPDLYGVEVFWRLDVREGRIAV